MPTDEKCLIELYHTCKSILFKHGGDPEAVTPPLSSGYGSWGSR